MSLNTELIVQAAIQEEAKGERGGILARLLRNPVGAICIVFLLIIVALGVLAPWIAPFPPNKTQLALTNAAPFTGEYLLGGDHAGRDILSRLLLSTTGTLQSAALLLIVSAAIGVVAGLIGGYYGGKADAVLSWFANIIMTLPGFVLLVALYTVVGPNMLMFMTIFGLMIAPSYFWLVRTLVVGVRSELYIDAARVSGLSDLRIIGRHVLQAVRGPIIIQSSFILAAGIGIQAGLQFLGLGDSSRPSWGRMLNDAFLNIYVAPVNLVWPALLISLVTLALVMLGNVVRDVMQSSGAKHLALKPKAVQRLRATFARDASNARAIDSSEPALRGADASAGRPALLRITGLELGYPDSQNSVRTVVKGVDLDLPRGEVHGLVGESGSGKSQIAFSILGILPKEAVILGGSIVFDGADLLASRERMLAARGRHIAYIPQEPMSNLDPTFTVGQQLIYGLRAVKKISKTGAKARLIDLLDRVGIKDPAKVFDYYPHQLSGGMAQRVLIAGALAGDPELIIADEPTTALDVTVQADVLDLLRGLQRERDLTLLLVTHNFGVVADICDRVSVMQQGRIVESKPTTELFASPEHEYTRMLLGSSLSKVPARKPLEEDAS